MNADEGRLGMAGYDTVQSFEQFLARRVDIRIPEPPTAVILEFLPSFIAAVERPPECLRIRHVNGYRHSQFPAFGPHRIEFRVIHRNELSLTVAQEEAQTFVLL